MTATQDDGGRPAQDAPVASDTRPVQTAAPALDGITRGPADPRGHVPIYWQGDHIGFIWEVVEKRSAKDKAALPWAAQTLSTKSGLTRHSTAQGAIGYLRNRYSWAVKAK